MTRVPEMLTHGICVGWGQKSQPCRVGCDWDNIQPEFLSQDLYQQACKRIMTLPIPDKDPVSGEALHHWLDAPSSTENWNDWRDSLDRTS